MIKRKHDMQSGFTIVELLIVIVVIAILAAISIVAYSGVQKKANNSVVQSDLSNNVKRMEQYKVVNGTYPVTVDEFHKAKPSFSLTAHRWAIYCASDDTVAFVSRSVGGNSYVASRGGVTRYDGPFDDSSLICERVGVTSPTQAAWLRGNGDWNVWVAGL